MRRISETKKVKQQDKKENWIINKFIISSPAPHHILLGWLNQGRRDERDMQYAQ
jgi:hypothetical protein